MQDLGSCVERRVGSSPTNRTICPEEFGAFFSANKQSQMVEAAYKQRAVTCDKTI